MFFKSPSNYSLFKQRRQLLLEQIQENYPDQEDGLVLLMAGFETERYAFRQESSFYYLTGITEPGAILCMYLDGEEVLYIPRFNQARDQWVNVAFKMGKDEALFEINESRYLGDQINGYSLTPPFTKEKYSQLLHDLSNYLDHKSMIFTLLDKANHGYFMQINLFEKLAGWLPMLAPLAKDISPIVHQLRRFKDDYEISLIHRAVQVTKMAHETAAGLITQGRFEYEVQAGVDYVFTHLAGAISAFPSIVATGKNTTVLHYTDRNHELKNADLVVVDIGAEYGGYAADLTRTYPVGGKFSKRQREVYEAVLKTQAHVEALVQPGMYLKNPQRPELSLHHLAVKYLDSLGFGQYFCHGIGHYLGLDVHDVGDYTTPLEEGDVFTIEPGIYIAKENLGVRIEDDYVVTEDGAVCLSFDLPKNPDEIEAMMAKTQFTGLELS
jgi:Xaa-Pro aminopeptidase